MKVKLPLICLVALGAAGTANIASAQVRTTGTLTALVEDQDGARIPNATVTATATDAATRRTAVTDREGVATLDALAPSALYVITVELTGFRPFMQENVLIRSGQVTTLRVFLTVGAVTEAVTVTAESSPVVDITNATTGQDITLQLTDAMPTGRSYQSYLQLVPSVLPDSPVTPGNPAVKSGLNYADIDGEAGVSRDNFYYLDGINVTDPVTGTFGANFNTEVIQEQKVITGGIPAEFAGAPGLISNVVSKSGSNSFHGSANYFFQSDNFVAEAKHGTAEQFTIKDTAFTIGGPAMRDHLFFFGSYRFNKRTDEVSSLDSTAFLREVDNTQKQGFAKGTWAPTFNDTLSATYTGDPTDITGRRERDILNPRDRSRVQGGHRYSFNYNRVMGSGGLIEASANKHNGEVSDFSVIRTHENTVIWRAGTPHSLLDEQLGGYGQDLVDQRDTTQARGSLQWSIGRHMIKGGAEYSRHDNFRNTTQLDNIRWFSLENGLSGITAGGIASGSFTQRNFISTNTSDLLGLIRTIDAHPNRAGLYAQLDLDSNGTISATEVGSAVVFNSTSGNPEAKVNYSRILQVQDGPQETRSDGLTFYLQDTVPIGRLTLNGGFRVERWEHFATTGEGIFTFPWEFGPRVSAVYDVLGDGRHKASVFYGIYFDPVRNNMTNFAGTLTGAIRHEQVFVAGEWLTYRIRGGPVQQDAFFTPSTQTPYTDDLQFGYEVDLGNNLSIGATFAKRRTRDILEDYDHHLYAEPAAYPGPIDHPDSLFLGPGYFGYDTLPQANFVISTLAGGKRDWKGLELVARKRYAENWQFLVSYNWNDATGNSNSDSNADFQGDVDYLDPRAPNQFGTQPGLIRHLFKAGGSYLFNWGLQLGLVARWNSGTLASLTELQSRRNLPIQVAPADAFEFAGYVNRWLAPDAVGGFQNPSWGTGDVRVEYVTGVGPTKLELFMDVFDIFNQQPAVRKQDLVAGRGAIQFGQEMLWEQPRRAFFGARVGF